MYKRQDFQTVGAEATGGAVRILSIHKSKGLEFPVVFVAGCAGQFNEIDLREPVLVHKELGFGSKCRDLARGVQYDTAERTAVAVRQRREMVSEELRVLYVALTRAKEKLIITAASGTLEKSLQKWARLAALDEIPQYAICLLYTSGQSIRTVTACRLTILCAPNWTRSTRWLFSAAR